VAVPRLSRLGVGARGHGLCGHPHGEHYYLRRAVALAEGLSIRATGRLLDVDKDTGNHWLPVLGRHCQGVMHYFFRHLHLRECQLDELWTFIAKKEDHLTPLEKLAPVSGDAWVWIAFSPVGKLVPAWVVGKRQRVHLNSFFD
jgi:hypothetical protein